MPMSFKMFLNRSCWDHQGRVEKLNLSSEVRLSTCTNKIRPLLHYASPRLGRLSGYLADDLQRVKDRCLNTTERREHEGETIKPEATKLCLIGKSS